MSTARATVPEGGDTGEARRVIEVQDLEFTYRKARKPAVQGLSFGVDRGEIFGFLGPSGAGKSTTQKLLMGVLSGHDGTIAVVGREPFSWGRTITSASGSRSSCPTTIRS